MHTFRCPYLNTRAFYILARECCLLVLNRQRVLFVSTQFSNLYRSENTLVRGGVGTQFSNLYTAVDTPARAA